MFKKFNYQNVCISSSPAILFVFTKPNTQFSRNPFKVLTFLVVDFGLFLTWPLLPFAVTEVKDGGTHFVDGKLLFFIEAQDVQGVLHKHSQKDKKKTNKTQQANKGISLNKIITWYSVIRTCTTVAIF